MLIAQYLSDAHALSQRLCTAFGVDDLWKGRRSRRIPVSGSADGLTFRFHGIGCAISSDTVRVDFDFLPGGKLGGFDAWRLHLFSEDNPSVVGRRGQDEVQRALEQLLAQGLVTTVNDSNLFVVTAANGPQW